MQVTLPNQEGKLLSPSSRQGEIEVDKTARNEIEVTYYFHRVEKAPSHDDINSIDYGLHRCYPHK
jgi:hypothetical protein